MNIRLREIKAIWNNNQGLYVIAGILIGVFLFPFLELIVSNLSELLIGLLPEAIGIMFTVFFLDQIYKNREIKELKQKLVNDARSQSNEIAKYSIDQMRDKDWVFGEGSLLKDSYLPDANLKNADLSYVNLSHSDLSNINLEGSNLFEADLSYVNLNGANLRGANLRGANLTGANLSNANISNTDLTFSDCLHAQFLGANLAKADIRYSQLDKTLILFANLKGANLNGTSLVESNLLFSDLTDCLIDEDTNFSKAVLRGAKYDKACIEEAILSEADMSDETSHDLHIYAVYETDKIHPAQHQKIHRIFSSINKKGLTLDDI